MECVPTSVSDCMNESLLSLISDVEIQDAKMQMGGLKALGPDGFQGVFYHSFWETIRGDVQAFVRIIEGGEVNFSRLNAIHIVLIPKVPNPKSISQF